MAKWSQVQGDSPRGTVPGVPARAATSWWDQRRNAPRQSHDNRKQHRTTVRKAPEPVRCNIPSTVEMPAKAQKMWGGRRFYVCGLLRDHDGPHRWPADPITLIAEWD